MFNAFSRSWQLGKQSLQVLKEDKQLVVFPLISSVACVLVLASFAVPLLATSALDGLWQSGPGGQHFKFEFTSLHYAVTFAFYLVNYAVIAFFNSALVAYVMKRFDGEPTSVGDGLKMAAARLPQILGWAVIAATVGMVLKAISDRSGIAGKIVAGLMGFVWTIAVYFVVPVLVVEGVGPIEAVKRSAATIRKTWGESLVMNLGLGAVSFVLFSIALIPLLGGIAVSIALQTVWPGVVGGALTIGLMIGV